MSAPPAPNTVPPHFASASLYVGDLLPDVTEAALYEIFHVVGPVSSIRVCRDSVTRKSLGYAYVNYHNVGDAERALDTLNFSGIKQQPCRIMWSHRDPALRKNNVGNVFVKNLDKAVDNKALHDTFSVFGNILSCKVATGPDGKSQGYGFIHFESDEAAKAAITQVNGMKIGQKEVFVGPFVRKEERGSSHSRFTNIYIKNFPSTWDEETLKKILDPFGKVTSMALRVDRRERGAAPFAFANFESFDDAQRAVDELNDKYVAGSGLVESAEEALKIPATQEEGEAEEEIPMKLYVSRHMTKHERAVMFKRQQAALTTPGSLRGKEPAVNLYIKNLADEVDDIALRAAFEEFGPVVSAKVMRNQKNQSRGFGFVSFENKDSAPKAVTEMHLKMFHNKPLYVGLAEKREQRFHRLSQRYRIPPLRPNSMMGLQAPNVQFSGGNQSLVYQQGPVMASSQNRGSGYIGYQNNQMNNQWRGPSQRPQYRSSGAPAVPMFPMGPGGPAQQRRGPRNRYVGGEPPREAEIESSVSPSPQAVQLQKQSIGEKLFPKIQRYQPQLAGKITGMMLEMETTELVQLLESDTMLKAKVDEALRVLEFATHQN
eukprot:GHVP01049067.1.p1 GENE.GHVP01049067.1~~GHVP01049067.1.p1  ORF type:complete len:600 (+),score=89.70 GHVP01049067.1:78-1877(+)